MWAADARVGILYRTITGPDREPRIFKQVAASAAGFYPAAIQPRAAALAYIASKEEADLQAVLQELGAGWSAGWGWVPRGGFKKTSWLPVPGLP